MSNNYLIKIYRREKVEFTMRFLISISDMSKDSLNSEQTYIKKCLLILLNYEVNKIFILGI